jgi:hypothetical protein
LWSREIIPEHAYTGQHLVRVLIMSLENVGESLYLIPALYLAALTLPGKL